jgi:hypothetical protein
MTKEFIPYEQALALKELGFDEPCLAFWDGKNTDAFYFNVMRDASGDYTPFKKHDRLKWFGAPLYQQAFRWFREKHNLQAEMVFSEKPDRFYYYMGNMITGDMDRGSDMSYKEAELECLKKLIELVKQ